MSDFKVLMVLYKEDFGDVCRIQLSMEQVNLIHEYIEEACTTDGKRPLDVNEYGFMFSFDKFLKECIRTEKKQNRLDNKSV